jgi:hypothetical protein
VGLFQCAAKLSQGHQLQTFLTKSSRILVQARPISRQTLNNPALLFPPAAKGPMRVLTHVHV